MCPSPQADGHDERRDRDDDGSAAGADDGGQVSETTAMTPGAGDGDTPGTDDGVPPADAADVEPGGGPVRSYGD